jgi:hypothetical protein
MKKVSALHIMHSKYVLDITRITTTVAHRQIHVLDLVLLTRSHEVVRQGGEKYTKHHTHYIYTDAYTIQYFMVWSTF